MIAPRTRIELLSRKDALKNGSVRYFTGRACCHGHIAERYTKGSTCVLCVLVYQREAMKRPEYRYKRNESLYRTSRLRKTGFSQELFDLTWNKQRGKCAICRIPLTKKSVNRDHCHETKRPRGLLCNACNTAEGFIKKTGLTPLGWAQRLDAYLITWRVSHRRVVV